MTAQSDLAHPEGATRTDLPQRIRIPRWIWLIITAEALVIGYLTWQVFHEQMVWSQRAAFLHASLGKLKEDAGDVTQALPEYGAAVKLYPDNAKAWYALGRALRKADPQRGANELQRAAKLAPADEAILREYGEALLEGAKLDEARVVLTRAVAIKPDDTAAHVALGRAYLDHVTSPADFDRGVQELREALRVQPGEIQARFRLARALFQGARLIDARQEFERTLSLLAEGAREQKRPMDGADHYSLMWLNLTKGCFHYLSDIAYRSGRRAEAEQRRRTFDALESYLSDTYPLFKRRRESPANPATQRDLVAVFRRYGLPPSGPDGPAAADRWIGSAASRRFGSATG